MPELHTHPGRYYIYYTTVVSCGWWYHNLMSDTVYCKGVFGTVPVFSVPVWMSHQTYRSVRYRYESLYRYRRYRYPCRTELTEVSGTVIDVIPNLPKCPVPVIPAVCLGAYRTEHTLGILYTPLIRNTNTIRTSLKGCLRRFWLGHLSFL